MNLLRHRIAAGIFALLIVVSGLAVPGHAKAFLPVIDPTNIVQTTITAGGALAYQVRKGPGGSGIGLDSIAWTVGKIAIQMMTKSVVNWINSGFNGSPSFITNFSSFLTQVADVTAGRFVSQLSVNAALRSPFQSMVAQNTSHMYAVSSSEAGFFASIQYTLGKLLGGNDSAFLAGNFSKGGWSAFFSASQFPQNNPIGAQMIASAQLRAQVAAAQGQQATQIGWGQGFISWCGNATGGGGGASQGGACKTDDDCAGALACVDAPEGHCAVDSSLENPANTCTNKDGSTGTIQTPGSVLAGLTNHTLGLSADTLVTADEFNEVIGALMSQLVSQVLGGTGLSGVASVSAGGTGYIDQAANPTQITDAQASSTQNSILTSSINTEMQSLQQYESDWQTILTQAQSTKAVLDQCSSKDSSDETTVTDIITQAQVGVAKGTVALAALSKISQDASGAITADATGFSASSGSIPSITNVATEFQVFLASPSTPSASEISYAHAQSIDSSVDTSGDTAQTLLGTLKEIFAGTTCPTGG